MHEDVPTASTRTLAASWSPTVLRDRARWRAAARTAFPFVVVGGLWEIVARMGIFPHRLFPPLGEGGVGVAIGIAMGRSRRAEDIFLPLVSIGAPIPGLAYAPLFMLWFGLGNFSAVLLVAFVSAFPIIVNSWTGVKAVKEIWIRSAQAMGADDRRLVRLVIVPGRAVLWRARVHKSRCDAGGHCRNRPNRALTRESSVQAARAIHGGPLGD